MDTWELDRIEQLEKKLVQHEQIITQLVEVIAATNKRLTALMEEKKEIKKAHTYH